MSATSGPAEHHASAARHHEQAARHHRQASKHYEVGKDYAHAAHQALIAHGHAWHAIDHAKSASRYYAEHDTMIARKYMEPARRFMALSLTASDALETLLGTAQHHGAAADHHEQAALYHGRAADHHAGHDDVTAAEDTHIAYGHARHAAFHGNEAAKLHVEHYGDYARMAWGAVGAA